MKEKELINRMLKEGKISREEADELLAALRKSYGYDSEDRDYPEDEDVEDRDTEDGDTESKWEAAPGSPERNWEWEKDSESEESEKSILDNLSSLFNNLLGPKQSIYEEHQGVFETAEPVIEIENTNGAVEVAGWDKDFFKLELEFKVNARNEEEAEGARQNALKYSSSGAGLRVKVVSKHFFKISANIRLYLPETGGYRLALSGINGKIDLKEISFKRGEVKLTNGKQRIRDVSGESLELRVSNGLINFQGAVGVLSSRVNNGGVNIIPELKGRTKLEMRTTNGNLKVMLPEEGACYFEGRTKNGLVSADYPGMETVKSETRIMKRHLVARTADWEESTDRIEIKARTTNGNIKLERIFI